MRVNLPLKLRCPEVIPIAWLLLFAQAPPLLDPVAIYLLLRQLQLRACSDGLYCWCHGEAPKNKSNLARPDGPLRAVNEDVFFCFVCSRLRFAPASGVVVEGCSGGHQQLFAHERHCGFRATTLRKCPFCFGFR